MSDALTDQQLYTFVEMSHGSFLATRSERDGSPGAILIGPDGEKETISPETVQGLVDHGLLERVPNLTVIVDCEAGLAWRLTPKALGQILYGWMS